MSVEEISDIPIPSMRPWAVEGRGYGAKLRNGLQNILAVVFVKDIINHNTGLQNILAVVFVKDIINHNTG